MDRPSAQPAQEAQDHSIGTVLRFCNTWGPKGPKSERKRFLADLKVLIAAVRQYDEAELA